MKKILVVEDMQKDFITGSLGTEEAKKIVPNVVKLINEFDGKIYATLDTHYENYLNTLEGKKLPVVHCQIGTDGWFLADEVEEALRESVYTIIHSVKGILEQTPPELSADIIDKGIILTGGGSLVDGFNQLLAQELKVPVFTAESPLTCVAEGTGIMLDNMFMLEK